MYKFVKCKRVDIYYFLYESYNGIILDINPFEFSKKLWIVGLNDSWRINNDYADNPLFKSKLSSDWINKYFFISDINTIEEFSEVKIKLWNELGNLKDPSIELIDIYIEVLNFKEHKHYFDYFK